MLKGFLMVAFQSVTVAAALHAQTGAPALRFEVASVKPAGAMPSEGSLLQIFAQIGRRVSGLRIDYPRESIKSMISLAYGKTYAEK